ncbi:hypothetical protein [Kitasatospora sp. NBC_01302]|uniref:hypothetical protein n=1 Tax=Kitasatospora sp. NBC_01302 TaxID=2903575 RepID=UPI002E11387C|nr:hypothetical protein OG294_06505 [Kitasatospora sp. NBC_01302]
MAGLLGFSQRVPEAAEQEVKGIGSPGGRLAEPSAERTRTPAPVRAASPAQSGGTVASTAPSAPLLLTPVAQEPVVLPDWSVPSLPAAAPRGPDAAGPRNLPLLAPRSTSAVLQAALSRAAWEGELDIARTVHRLATGRPLAQVPRHGVPTLRFGVQVLVDLGLGMEPFHRDQQELIGQVRNTVGRERTEIRYFEHSPLRGAGAGARLSWEEYSPPPRGTRVLVLSDLGLGGPALDRHRSTPGEWQALAARLARAGCTAVGFIPYPPGRWPRWASEVMELVHWDRRTTVGRVGRRRRPTRPPGE